MTPAARLSAAIAILDAVLGGAPAERALTNWGRASRFAGSGDRAAVRDLVFDALRCKRSAAARGGGMTGRGLVLGGLRARGADVEGLFTGIGHAPQPVLPSEAGHAPDEAERLDCPDWLLPHMQRSLGPQAEAVLQSLRHRAPVYLRVNLARTSRAAARQALAEEGIVCADHPTVATALDVLENARKLQTSACYRDGRVELQDAASQAVVADLPLRDGLRVLDYCAGGGGKTLAMAAIARIEVWAHDASPARMADLPVRAARAGVKVTVTENPAKTAPYDLILMDVPCSGSGSWRRDPEGKWALTPDRLVRLGSVQAEILDRAAALAGPVGVLAYVTCSLLHAENEDQVAAFMHRSPGWTCPHSRRFSPLDGGDGFFLAVLTRNGLPPTQL